jgi:YegS/Rv2252/BmrU family lipid kinase
MSNKHFMGVLQLFHFIVNPASSTGNGAKIWRLVEQILLDRNVDYTAYLTEGMGSAEKLSSAISSRYSKCTLVIIGGDGTMNEVLNGIDNYADVTLGYIPAGSSNDFARDLQITCNPTQALLAILNPKEYAYCDVGIIKYDGIQRNFGVSTGIGYDAAVCHEVLHSPMKRYLNKIHLGKLIYLYVALKQLAATKRYGCDIILDGSRKIHLDNYYFVTTMIHKFEGGGFKFCPEANCADGILDVCTVNNISKLWALRILPTAFSGKHVNLKGVGTYKAKEIKIISDVPAAVHMDGESAGMRSEVSISLAKQQLRIIIK